MPHFSIMLILIGSIVTGPSAHAGDQDKLETSLKTWQELKKKHEGNYSYTISWSSFSGFGHETEIIVRDGKIVERRYRTFNRRAILPQPGQPAKKPDGKKWVEKGKAIGSHQEGAPAKTLDELYAEAAKVLKRELPEHERLYLRFDKQGLLQSCFTVDTRIADDAPRKGVMVSKITLGKDELGAKAPNGKFFPKHWGDPPRIQTRDLRPLPGGYGRGSSTLAGWIQRNLDRDAEKKKSEE